MCRDLHVSENYKLVGPLLYSDIYLKTTTKKSFIFESLQINLYLLTIEYRMAYCSRPGVSNANNDFNRVY